MKKFLKIVAGVVAFIVVVVVAAAIILPLVINPNDFKPRIQHLVKEKTGRQLTIPGDIDLSVFPTLALSIGSARLSEAPGFGDKPFARIQQARVRVELWPLLHGKLRVDRVAVDGLQAHLIKTASGKTNWQGLLASPEKSGHQSASGHAPAQEHTHHAGQKQGKGGQLNALHVASLEISDAEFTYHDKGKHSRYRLQKTHLQVKDLGVGKPFPLQLHFRLTASRPAVTAKVDLSGKVTANPAQKRYEISSMKVKVEASGKGVPGGSQTISLQADAKADLGAQTARIDNLLFKMAGITTRANVRVHNLTSNPAYEGKLDIARFNPRAVMKRLDMKAPNTRDPRALSRFSLTSRFSGNTKEISLKNLGVRLDKTRLSGQASVSDLEHPRIRFDLALDRINVDRYLPPRGSKGNKGSKGQKDTAKRKAPAVDVDVNSIEVPVDRIKPLDLDGTLSIGSLSVMNLDFRKSRLKVKAQNGVLKIRPLAADAYKGNVHLTSTIHAGRSQPTYAVSAELKGIQASPLLQDLIGKKFLDANGKLSLHLTSSGKTVGAIRRHLDGKLQLHLSDGTIRGFSLSSLLGGALKQFGKGSATKGDKTVNTRFQGLEFRANVKNGTLHSRHLSAHGKWFKLNGSGSADLVSNKVDYVTRVTLTGQPPGMHGDALAVLRGVAIPVHFSGGFKSVGVNVDAAGVVNQVLFGRSKQQTREKVNARKEKARDNLQNKLDKKQKELKDKAGQALQHLFGD